MAIMTHYHKAFFLTTIKTSKNIMREKNLTTTNQDYSLGF